MILLACMIQALPLLDLYEEKVNLERPPTMSDSEHRLALASLNALRIPRPRDHPQFMDADVVDQKFERIREKTRHTDMHLQQAS